jgi:peptide/nickel transport system substrate-binding protein
MGYDKLRSSSAGQTKCQPRSLTAVIVRSATLLCVMAAWLSLPCAPAAARNLRIVDSSKDPLTLYPHNSFDPNSDLVISQIFEGLIEFDADGQLIPRLAERWEKISPTRYRFWLRRGVTFHNGEPFDAETVRFSLDRQLRGPRKSANAWLFDPDFHAEVVSSHVVDLVTQRPDARLPYTLPMFVKIVPPRYVSANTNETLEQHPIGTGPYRFVEWKKGCYIKLQANPGYWKAGLPRIRNLEFLFLDKDRQVPALLAGDADLVTKLDGKDTLEVMRAPDTEVQKRHVAAVFWAAMKTHDSPFANLKVRQAMNYAVNKRHLIQYVAKGNSLLVSSMTNPLEIGFNPNLHPYPFDPQKAKQLLREAGYENGFRVRALAAEETKHMVFALQAQLRMVGVDLDVTVVTREEYLRQTIVPKLQTGRPSFDGDMVIWLTPNPTLNAFFNPAVIFYSQSPYSIIHDAEFDRLYDHFVRTSDPEENRESIYKLQAYMTEQAFGIYTAQRVRTIALRRGLQIKLPPTDSLFGFTLAEAYWLGEAPLGGENDQQSERPGPEK